MTIRKDSTLMTSITKESAKKMETLNLITIKRFHGLASRTSNLRTPSHIKTTQALANQFSLLTSPSLKISQFILFAVISTSTQRIIHLIFQRGNYS